MDFLIVPSLWVGEGVSVYGLFCLYLFSQRGELDKAQADYNHLRVLDPNNFDARFGLALLAQKKKDFRTAMESLNTLINEYNANGALYLARANVEMDITHPYLALIAIERSTSICARSGCVMSISTLARAK